MGNDDELKPSGRMLNFSTLLSQYKDIFGDVAKGLRELERKPSTPQVNPDDIPTYDGIEFSSPGSKELDILSKGMDNANKAFEDSIGDLIGAKERQDAARNIGLEAINKQNAEIDQQLKEMNEFLRSTSGSPDITSFTGNLDNAPTIDDEVKESVNKYLQTKKDLIDKILELMSACGEFSRNTNEDIVRRVEEARFERRQLEGKTIEELEEIRDVYIAKKEELDKEELDKEKIIR